MAYSDYDIDSAVKDTVVTSLKIGKNDEGSNATDYSEGDRGPHDGQFRFADPQTIDMNDAQVALTTLRAASATQITSNILYVDPNSAGGTEDLLLPPEAECKGLVLHIVNTAGGAEDIVVKEDADSTTIMTLNQNEQGVAVCDGTTWRGATLSSTAEQAFLSGVTAGTVTASKAVVVDASKDIGTFNSVDVITVTNADLVLESLNAMQINLNDTGALQLDNAAISGFAAAADAAGTDVFIETQDGGADTAVDGAVAGGLLNIKTGDAGGAGADQVGAAGGALTLITGAGSAGGAHSAANPAGGDGGAVAITGGVGGVGGSGGSGAGGAGGAITITTGIGGASGSGGTGTSGAGGALGLVAGAAGTAAADTPGGAGGAVSITAGAGSAGGTHTANNPDGGDGGDITLTVGAAGAAGGGTGVAGDTGKVKVSGGCLDFANAQTIDMADVQVALTRNPGTPVGTEVVSNVLFVDANSTTNEDLLLPPEADCDGLVLYIFNTGGEDINVKDDGDSTTIVTVSTTESAVVGCDGTTWFGGMMTTT